MFARVSSEPLEVAEHLGAVSDERAGAIATFIGQVRNHDPGASGEVTGLDYSAHPGAEQVLAAIVASYPDALIAVSHRIGALAVGDLALVACVATAHRAEAFDICRELVERVKAELPIWKRQHSVDGTVTWVGIA